MASNTVTISGMFGSNKTYFADSPVIIDISGLQWPASSPFDLVLMDVMYGGRKAGDFRQDTGGQSAISFEISSALHAIWNDYTFDSEVTMAQAALTAATAQEYVRAMREYSLRVRTEYLAGDGVFTPTDCGEFQGGRCLIGGLTEWERSTIGAKENADASHWEHSNLRNGDASTKPASSPERVGRDSITSWVDVSNTGTRSIFYPKDITGQADSVDPHAPLVLRDNMAYQDFLFVNRRGAVETCSGQMLEAMDISVETKTYDREEGPAFKPSRTLMTVTEAGPRRSWQMSSGRQTREWAVWWAQEFLTARRVWMLYEGAYVPVIVEPAKKSTSIYDKTKQQMPHVDFTVTLALEG